MATRGRETHDDNANKTTGQGPEHRSTWELGGPAFRPGLQHPEPWRDDLNPDRMAGQNVGLPDEPRPTTRTAYDDKVLHDRLREIPDDVLKSAILVPRGSRLKQGATYFDLAHPDRGKFTAMGDETASPDERLIAKAEMGYDEWDLLTGVQRPLGREDRRVKPEGYDLKEDTSRDDRGPTTA